MLNVLGIFQEWRAIKMVKKKKPKPQHKYAPCKPTKRENPVRRKR